MAVGELLYLMNCFLPLISMSPGCKGRVILIALDTFPPSLVKVIHPDFPLQTIFTNPDERSLSQVDESESFPPLMHNRVPEGILPAILYWYCMPDSTQSGPIIASWLFPSRKVKAAVIRNPANKSLFINK